MSELDLPKNEALLNELIATIKLRIPDINAQEIIYFLSGIAPNCLEFRGENIANLMWSLNPNLTKEDIMDSIGALCKLYWNMRSKYVKYITHNYRLYIVDMGRLNE